MASEIRFQLRASDTIEEKVRSLITQAVGGGSACWHNLSGAGVFDDEKAIAVADAAYDQLRMLLGFDQPEYPPGMCFICGDPNDHFGNPHSWVLGDGKTRADLAPDEGYVDPYEKYGMSGEDYEALMSEGDS